jgi:hypothetical protein
MQHSKPQQKKGKNKSPKLLQVHVTVKIVKGE